MNDESENSIRPGLGPDCTLIRRPECRGHRGYKALLTTALVLHVVVALLAHQVQATSLPYFSVVRVERVLGHDPYIFTEGLTISEDELFESSGLWGYSGIIARRLQTTQHASGTQSRLDKRVGTRSRPRVYPLPKNLFGEGLAVWGPLVFQLTYREGLAILYDKQHFPVPNHDELSTRTFPPPSPASDLLERRRQRRVALTKYLDMIRSARSLMTNPGDYIRSMLNVQQFTQTTQNAQTQRLDQIAIPYPTAEPAGAGLSQEGWGLAAGPTTDQLSALRKSGVAIVASLGSSQGSSPATVASSQSLTLNGEFPGIALEESLLYSSDGTSTIRLIDPTRFQDAGRLEVHIATPSGKIPLSGINELEFVVHPALGIASAIASPDPFPTSQVSRRARNQEQIVTVGIAAELWANLGGTDCIARIDPHSGLVKGFIWAGGLDKVRHRRVNMMNGIGYDLTSFLKQLLNGPNPGQPQMPTKSWDDEQEEMDEKKRQFGAAPVLWGAGPETPSSTMIREWLNDRTKIHRDNLKVFLTGKLWPKMFEVSPIDVGSLSLIQAVLEELEMEGSSVRASEHARFFKGYKSILDPSNGNGPAAVLEKWQARLLAGLFIQSLRSQPDSSLEASLRRDRRLLEQAVRAFFTGQGPAAEGSNTVGGIVDVDTGVPRVCVPGFGYGGMKDPDEHHADPSNPLAGLEDVTERVDASGMTVEDTQYQSRLIRKGPLAREVEIEANTIVQ